MSGQLHVRKSSYSLYIGMQVQGGWLNNELIDSDGDYSHTNRLQAQSYAL